MGDIKRERRGDGRGGEVGGVGCISMGEFEVKGREKKRLGVDGGY